MDTKTPTQDILREVVPLLEWMVEHSGEYRLVRGKKAAELLKTIQEILSSEEPSLV